MLNVSSIRSMKSRKKIVMLTAYDYIMASLVEQAGIDIVLVGDSLGMVFQGTKETLPVTVDEIIYHSKAVKRGAPGTFITADMPFMSYQTTVEDAVRNGGRIIKESGASALKLEGGAEIIPQVKALLEIGIPVMGHIGLQPQSVNKYGGYPVMGATPEQSEKLISDAVALEKAGVFSIVVEKVKSETTAKITASVSVPVIGIGSGPECDGQVLVVYDMLGFFEDFTPKFVKKYDNMALKAKTAVGKYASEVRSGSFPAKKNFY
jgi:3-methyl-2-oxobutanoate hydroxymethyltransferase